MSTTRLSSMFIVAFCLMFTVALVPGCGEQTSTAEEGSGSAEMSQTHDDGHDHDHEDHGDHTDEGDKHEEEHADEEGHDDEHENRAEHFQGEKVESWEQAVNSLREKNQKLSELLENDELSASQMQQIHRMSYTLENAIGQIRDELDRSAETLEEVHLASEEREVERIRNNAEIYLGITERLTD